MADEERIEFTIEGKDKASSVFSSVGGSITKLGVAASAAVVAFAALVKHSADVQEEIGDLDKVTKLGVETLSELSHIAVITNTSTEGLANGFKFMSKAASEAARGNQQASDSFDLLGVELKDSNGQMKSSSALMADLGDALNKVHDPIERTALGLKIFGRGWQDVAKATADGSDGMRKLAEDAKFLGVTMTAQGVSNASAFNDQLDRVSQAVKGASMAIANEWIPILTGFARSTADGIAGSREALRQFSKDALTFTLTAFATIEEVGSKVWAKIEEWFSSAEGFDNFVENAQRAFNYLFDVAAMAMEHIFVAMGAVFKLVWESFVELGKWAFQKIMDVITGQNLADSLGEVLFQRIPEATAETRADMSDAFKGMKTEWVNTFKEGAEGIEQVFGISAESISARVDEIKAKFTELGQVEQETNEKSEADERIANQRRLQERLAYLQQKQALIDQSLMTEQEQYALSDEINQIRLEMALEQKYLTEDQYKQKSEVLELQKQARLGSIQAQAELNRQKVAAMSTDAQLKYTADNLTVVAALMSSHNETQFKIGKAAAIAQAVINTYQAATAAFASASAIPFVGWILGPIAAASAVALGLANVSKIKSAQMSGQAHAGMTSVPNEGTFLLDKGERVISPEQNRDLTSFLDNGGSGGGVHIENLHISVLENATSIDALMSLSPRQVSDLIAAKFIPALDSLDRQGIRPLFVERFRR